MIIESISILIFAVLLDLITGDPKTKYHPTGWIGEFIAKLVPLSKKENPIEEKISGIELVVLVTGTVAIILVMVNMGLNYLSTSIAGFTISIIIGGILLKTTIAIRGLQKHALMVVDSIEQNDLDSARDNLSLIVKRDTKNLDKNHVLSGVLESVSENTVDAITSPLFYFALFGLPGAFVYRTINTFDAMVGYKTVIFKNLGWFGANCDMILNYIPARMTAYVMILAAMILKNDWKRSYQTMKQDANKLSSPNAGYPMSVLAGALGTKFEKIDHYTIGDGDVELTKDHVKSAIILMKTTSILFCGIVCIPLIVALTYLGWWVHA